MTNAERIKEIEDRTAKAIKALDVGGTSGAFLCVMPIGEDIPWLLSTLRAVEADNARLRAALETADTALTEAEAILGGEYGDFYHSLMETMFKLREQLAAQDPRP